MKKLYAGALLGLLLVSMNAFGAVDRDRLLAEVAEEPNKFSAWDAGNDFVLRRTITHTNPELVELLNAQRVRKLTDEELKRLIVLQDAEFRSMAFDSPTKQ